MGLNPDTVRTLDLLAAQHRGRSPSLVLAAGRHGALLHHTGAPEIQYRIGSITKTFTAALVLQLRDEGRLDLDDPLDRHLPGTPVGTVTVRQLLTHVSGLVAEPAGPWWERSPGVDVETLLRGLDAGALALPAGVRHYSNLGYGLLGAAIEAITGEPWRDRLSAGILAPLGLHRTTYQPADPHARGFLVHPWEDVTREEPTPDTGAMAPAGQLWSTTGDLLAWGRVLAQGRPGVLDPATAAEMRMPAVDADEPERAFGGLGLLLTRRGDRTFCGHSGSMPGFLACLAVDPPSGWAAVTFANSYTDAPVTTLAHRTLEAVLAAPGEPDGLAGSWWWMGHHAVVGYEGGRLVIRQDDETWWLEPAGDERWRCVEGPQVGETLAVDRDAAGSVAGWEIRTFRYVRDPWPPDPR